MTPDVLYDQMIGMGTAHKLVFSYAGNPGVGSLHRLRDAVEHGWPRPIEIEEHSHAGIAKRYTAGASNLPFAVLRAYSGTDLAARTNVLPITCPFTGEQLTAVPALRPDVTVVHAQEADRRGNVQLWGIPGVQKEAVLAAKRSLATVERIVTELEPKPGGIVLPCWVIDAVAEVPGGSRPSYAHGVTERDNSFYRQWDQTSRGRDLPCFAPSILRSVPPPIRRGALRVHASDSFPADTGLRPSMKGSALPISTIGIEHSHWELLVVHAHDAAAFA
jgi:glutaconate CoA-transferase, subunit A